MVIAMQHENKALEKRIQRGYEAVRQVFTTNFVTFIPPLDVFNER